MTTNKINALVALIVGEISQRGSLFEIALEWSSHLFFTAWFCTKIIMNSVKIAPKLIEPALQRAKQRQLAEMPLANETGDISEWLQTLREGRLIQWETDELRVVPWLHGSEIITEAERRLVLSRH
jgi:hypothetical protein